MRVVFSHGREGSPKSSKTLLLSGFARIHNLDVSILDYTVMVDPEQRVQKLMDFMEQPQNKSEDIILVGSSMGGYVSTVVASQRKVAGLFLMAPAFGMDNPAYKTTVFEPKTGVIDIVHGFKDTVIPFMNSVHFGQKHKARVCLLEDEHRLGRSSSSLIGVFTTFLADVFESVAAEHGAFF